MKPFAARAWASRSAGIPAGVGDAAAVASGGWSRRETLVRMSHPVSLPPPVTPGATGRRRLAVVVRARPLPGRPRAGDGADPRTWAWSRWSTRPPAARARRTSGPQDLMAAFEDPEIGAVMSTVGGDDQVTVLRHLEADADDCRPEALPRLQRQHPPRQLALGPRHRVRLRRVDAGAPRPRARGGPDAPGLAASARSSAAPYEVEVVPRTCDSASPGTPPRPSPSRRRTRRPSRGRGRDRRPG